MPFYCIAKKEEESTGPRFVPDIPRSRKPRIPTLREDEAGTLILYYITLYYITLHYIILYSVDPFLVKGPTAGSGGSLRPRLSYSVRQ